MTLYEINTGLMECFDEDGYCIDVERLEALYEAQDEKLDNIACFIKNLRADVAAYKAEEKSFAERRKAAEKRIESLENYLTACMAGTKFEGKRARISWRRSYPVVIDDESAVPAECRRTKIEVTIDKDAVKKLLESQPDVQWAHIEERFNPQIK